MQAPRHLRIALEQQQQLAVVPFVAVEYRKASPKRAIKVVVVIVILTTTPTTMRTRAAAVAVAAAVKMTRMRILR